MKDIRGSHASAVRSAIFRHFNLPTASTRRKNSMDVSEWKRSKEVNDSYKKLYSDTATLETIVDIAFPSLSIENEEEFSDMYIYTASVYDIILNPNHPSIEILKKPLELRFKRF